MEAWSAFRDWGLTFTDPDVARKRSFRRNAHGTWRAKGHGCKRLPTIGDAKAGNDIPIPLTPAILDALKLATKAAPDHEPGDLIFPGCAQVAHREQLPTRGRALRRTFKTIATAHCKVPDDVSAFLLGHVPEGMSQKYLLRWALSSGPAIREAQATISREMVRLLHRRRGKAAIIAEITARAS